MDLLKNILLQIQFVICCRITKAGAYSSDFAASVLLVKDN